MLPDPIKVRFIKFEGHEYGYRMRVGDWRILFDVKDRIRIITIQEVKKRDEYPY
jgi:mRNA-degrading endonuclease RelE of RelBE toxin-antitoxin system